MRTLASGLPALPSLVPRSGEPFGRSLACHRCYSAMAGEALNPSADEETPKKPLPHPPPARAVRPRPSRLGARVGPSDSSLPPAPPAGGEITLQYQTHKEHPNSLAGTCLRFVALRSAKSPLSHYFTLDREQGASFAARAYARSFFARSPSLRCSSLGALRS